MALDNLLRLAVEDRESAGEDRGAGDELRPDVVGKASIALEAAATGEAIGYRLMAGGQDIDREMAGGLDLRPGRGVAIDADDHGRWLGRERGQRCRGQAGPLAAMRGGDDADRACDIAHHRLEGICMDVVGIRRRKLLIHNCHRSPSPVRIGARGSLSILKIDFK